jgi:hypothetical protein
VVKNRPKPLHVVKNAVSGCFLSNPFQEHFQPKTIPTKTAHLPRKPRPTWLATQQQTITTRTPSPHRQKPAKTDEKKTSSAKAL